MNKINIYTTWKTGSSFTNRFFKYTCKQTGLPFLFLPEKHTNTNIIRFKKRNKKFAIFPVRTPFENYIKNETYIIHLRDPRDILVSAYFSVKFSHKYTKAARKKIETKFSSIDVNNFVKNRAFKYAERNKNLFNSIDKKNINYIFYEDMVLNFPKWAKIALSSFNVDEDVQRKIIKAFQGEFLNIPNIENIYEHKRRMLPGDYKEKLTQETILKLNDILKEHIQFYNYCKKESNQNKQR